MKSFMSAIAQRLFVVIKYVTYGWLTWNGYLFYVTEAAASGVTFSSNLDLSEIIEVYSASIDTTFWILLVILLELETFVIDDEILKKASVKWGMTFLRSICYGMILYAFYGYSVKAGFQTDIVRLAVADACDLVGQGYSILVALEEYIPLTAENCQPLAGQELSQLNGHKIIGPHGDLIYARNVAWIDIFNASTWIAVVAILEVDVWLQLKGAFHGRALKISTGIKVVLYSILFACAVAWGVTGVFLDFTDAFLWLFAFFFIELNLFQWQKETEEAEAEA